MVPDSDASRIARLEQNVSRIEQRVEDHDYLVKAMTPVATQVGVQTVRIDNLDHDVRTNQAAMATALAELKVQMTEDRRAWQSKLADKEAEASKERQEAIKAARDQKRWFIGLVMATLTAMSSGVVAALIQAGG